VTGHATDVSLVVDFLNTLDVEEETDVLAEAATWRRWAGDRDLTPDALHTARATRDALRAAVGDPAATRAPLAVGVQIELAPEGATLVTAGAVGAVLAAATRVTVLGEWPRVKICPADDCRWAFYDESRNRSRTWCSMRVCGNREKARAWRERTGQQTPE
jgi:predicted RNA-binding Zn ribbon-like protein